MDRIEPIRRDERPEAVRPPLLTPLERELEREERERRRRAARRKRDSARPDGSPAGGDQSPPRLDVRA